VFDLDQAGVEGAMSLALPASLAPTTRQTVDDGTLVKRFQPGFASRHGVTAALLAAAGIAGSPAWFGGRFGIAAAVSDEDAALTRLTSSSGWQVGSLSLKPYPTCRYTHAAIAGTARLLETTPATAVDRLLVRVPSGSGHEIVARPWHRRGHPLVDAQFSIPWLCAAVLERGSVGMRTLLDDALPDPAIEARAGSVRVLRDQPAGSTVMTPVRVAAVLADGSPTEEILVDAVPGAPDRPLGWPALLSKAAECTGDEAAARELYDAVRTLPEQPAGEPPPPPLLSVHFGQFGAEVLT
jgi:2-methylcitrate dehydratase PrpD